MNASELFKQMPVELSKLVLDHVHNHNKKLNRELLTALAQVRKLRLVALQRIPRGDRFPWLIAMLQQPPAVAIAFQAISSFLLIERQAMLVQFLTAVGVEHDGTGCATVFPADPPSTATLGAAIDALLANFPRAESILYLHAFNSMAETQWPELEELLLRDPRLLFEGATASEELEEPVADEPAESARA